MAIDGNTNRQAYNASVQLDFLLNDQVINIATERIKYIVIDSNFETEIMPKIYMSISVNTTLYDYITNYKNEGYFRLIIRRKNVFAVSSLDKTILDDTFAYIPSTSNNDYLKSISVQGVSDDSYKNIVIGLISTKITDLNRKSFNLIYNNIDQQTLISLVLEGSNSIIQQLSHNEKYDSIIIPPMSSKKEFLDFIFEMDNFYDTNFLFFTDFRNTYLLSRNGEGVPGGDDDLNDVYIDIKQLSNEESYYDGIDIINGAYYLYINPANSNVIIPNALSKIANRLIVVDDDRELQTLDLSISQAFNNTIKEIFIRSENGSVYKNALEQDNVIIEISKKQIDGFSFTPNKNYIINNFGTYSKYNGKYILAGKKEYFRVTADGDFTTSCYLALRKVNNIASKQNSYISPDKTNIRPSAQSSSSSDLYSQTNIISASGNR